jgi:serine/threonine protein kinase
LNPEFPDKLDRFEIRGLLGEGGMGQVLHGFDPKMGQDVAIKVIHPALLTRSKVYARATRELQVMLSLRAHPNIVTVLDYVESPFAVVMEFLEGDNLYDLLESIGGPLPYDEALRHGLEMVDALGFAHEKGVLHRDIKSGNVMLVQLGKKRKVKVLDFGLASFLEDDQDNKLTRAGARLGTPGYMAPEQHLGQPVDVRTDVYAAGIVLFEMFTGKTPFHQYSTSEYETTRAQLELPMLRPTQLVGELPQGLDAVILKATARQADDRYSSCEELAADLEALQRGESVTAALSPILASSAVASPEALTVALDKEPVARPELSVASKPGARPPTAAPATIFEDDEQEPAEGLTPESTVVASDAPVKKKSLGWVWGVLGALIVGLGVTVALLLVTKDDGKKNKKASTSTNYCEEYKDRLCADEYSQSSCESFTAQLARSEANGNAGDMDKTCERSLATWNKRSEGTGEDTDKARAARERLEETRRRCEKAQGTYSLERGCMCVNGLPASVEDCEELARQAKVTAAANEELARQARVAAAEQVKTGQLIERMDRMKKGLCTCVTKDCLNAFQGEALGIAGEVENASEKASRHFVGVKAAVQDCMKPIQALDAIKTDIRNGNFSAALSSFDDLDRTSPVYTEANRVVQSIATHEIFNTYLDSKGETWLVLRSEAGSGAGWQLAKMVDGTKVRFLEKHGNKARWWKVFDLTSRSTGWAHSNWIRPISR